MPAMNFPTQGSFLMREVEVCFDHDPAKTLNGVVVRDDAEPPGRMIIKLENGKYVLSTECHYRFREATANDVAEIKREHFDAISRREAILLVKSDYGWDVEQWFPDGVAPTSSYDIPQEAAARALQLMKLKDPVTPQDWPEIAQIGNGGGPPPKPKGREQ